MKRRRVRAIALAAISGAVAASLAGCGQRHPRPNVLLIVVDALRADRLGCYGYARRTSPNLDALAEEGVIFSDVMAPASETALSIPSLMTGRRARETGEGWIRQEGKVYARHGTSLPTLAEMLRRHGYRTAAFCANRLIGPGTGTDRGFEEFDYPIGRLPVWRKGSAEDVNRCVFSWLDRYRPRSGPFFLYVHYIDPHNLYRPPEEFCVFGRPGYTADDERANIELNLVSDPPDPAFVTDAALAKHGLSRREVARMSDLYDGEVLSADHAIGEVLRRLKDARLYEDTLVIVTADHGEAFLEHHDLEHGRALYQELVHVPLIMRLPGLRGGQEVREVVESIDIAPTVIDAVGLSGAAPMSGRSLYPELTEGRPLAPRLALAELPSERTYAVRQGSLKLIVAPSRAELYDLARDPGERNDLAASRPQEVARLRAALQGELARRPAAEASAEPASQDDLDALRALGYIH